MSKLDSVVRALLWVALVLLWLAAYGLPPMIGD